MTTTLYLKLTVEYVDGPRRNDDELATAVENSIAGETVEVLSHPPTHRSRYLIDDAQVVGREEVP